ncbi:MAG: hypothetical protein ACI9WC_002360 [Arenicella sp.]|jgi:hypothetical protein
MTSRFAAVGPEHGTASFAAGAEGSVKSEGFAHLISVNGKPSSFI